MTSPRKTVPVTLALFLLLQGTALAKGASEAVLRGPGLSSPLRFTGNGEPGTAGRLARVAEASGVFAAMFGQRPNPLRDERPPGDLGPRFTLTYVVPGPVGDDEIIQAVYPYAQGGPVTYTAPGQDFFEVEKTKGGWLRASSGLKTLLVSQGLPRHFVGAAKPASPASSSGSDWSWVLLLVTIGAMVGIVSVGLRRRAVNPQSR